MLLAETSCPDFIAITEKWLDQNIDTSEVPIPIVWYSQPHISTVTVF